MKKTTVKKKTPVKAKAPSPAPVSPDKPMPTTAAEARAYLGIDYDHVFIGPSGRRFALLAVEGSEAVMQCQDCGQTTRVPLEAVLKAEVRTEVNERDEEESDIKQLDATFPADHPLRKLLDAVNAAGGKASIRRLT